MKFQKLDEQYLSQRKDFSEKYGPRELWSVMDHWPLYCGVSNLSRFMAIADLLRETLTVPGHIAEFGSWRGANLMFLTKLLKIYDPMGSKVVHCLESFEGLTAFSEHDLKDPKQQGLYRGSLEELEDLIELYQLQDDIEIHKGLIEKSLPDLLDKNKALTFSFVYCDTDLYESTKTILENIHPRLAKGGIIVFDEWNYSNYPGEGLAVNEFLEKMGSHYEVRHIIDARQPSLMIKKIKM